MNLPIALLLILINIVSSAPPKLIQMISADDANMMDKMDSLDDF